MIYARVLCIFLQFCCFFLKKCIFSVEKFGGLKRGFEGKEFDFGKKVNKKCIYTKYIYSRRAKNGQKLQKTGKYLMVILWVCYGYPMVKGIKNLVKG